MLENLKDTADLLVLNMGEQLQSRRKELGLSQEELAERAGINRMSVARAEAGAGNPQMATLVSMALALNLRPALSRSEEDGVHPADIVHRGTAYGRTAQQDHGRDREREKALAEEWEEINRWRRPGVQSIMTALVPGHTQEQASAAATAVQWLGSTVGFELLTDVLVRAGYCLVDNRSRPPGA